MKKCLYIFLLGLGVVSNQALYCKQNDNTLKLVTLSFALIQEVQKEVLDCHVLVKNLANIQDQIELENLGYNQAHFTELQKLVTKAEIIISKLNVFLCKAQIHLNPLNIKEFSKFNSEFKTLYNQLKKIKSEFLTQGIQI